MQAIVTDLEEAGYITRTRDGRRTRYNVNPDSRFRHPAQDGHQVGPLLALLATPGEARPRRGDWCQGLRIAGATCPPHGHVRCEAPGGPSVSGLRACPGSAGSGTGPPGRARGPCQQQ